MYSSKKLLVTSLLSFSLLFTACTKQPEPTANTDRQVVTENNSSNEAPRPKGARYLHSSKFNCPS